MRATRSRWRRRSGCAAPIPIGGLRGSRGSCPHDSSRPLSRLKHKTHPAGRNGHGGGGDPGFHRRVLRPFPPTDGYRRSAVNTAEQGRCVPETPFSSR
ncbi:hypothetical protein B005_0397 [Nocardiopsis alba ATCC BAA-2165]|uniref:Uncharacterized protein n=1 Tax=Nocardiopsis alba (strain ATCC BAA-2165 / BE74) TaxID=1205910 RepID=J7LHT5_NOCAA|nr:hypothetical protein B005_0397 [Nocardiopsis alba ATCC BAA-2165]